MKVKGSWLAAALSVGLLVSGCASGDNFQFPGPKSLVIGKTSPQQVEEMMLGHKAAKTKRESNADGSFDTAIYLHHRTTLVSARGRVLIVEYRAGILNGYIYLRNFDNDKTKVAMEKLPQVQPNVSTTNDVLRIMGEPDGKAIGPTTMTDFAEKCKKGVQTWGWITVSPKPHWAWGAVSKESDKKFAYVTFDDKGLVTEVGSTDDEAPR